MRRVAGLAFVFAAIAVCAVTCSAQPVLLLQWATTATPNVFVYPAQAPFRNGDIIGFAAVMEDQTGGVEESTYSVCEFYNVLDEQPAWCYDLAASWPDKPMVLGGSDNSVFAALVNGTGAAPHATYTVLRWASDPDSDTPDLAVSGNATGAVLGLSGNGDVLAVIEQVSGGSSVSLFGASPSAPAYATAFVPMEGRAIFGVTSFGSPAPVLFMASGLNFAYVSTFTAEPVHTGQLTGIAMASCNGGELVLVREESGLAVYGFDAKTAAFALVISQPASTGALSASCSTAAFIDVNEGHSYVYNTTRTTAVLAASFPTPYQAYVLAVSDSGAAVVLSNGGEIFVLAAPYTGTLLSLELPIPGRGVSVDHLLVFEPPAPNGVLAYIVGNCLSPSGSESALFVMVLNATASA